MLKTTQKQRSGGDAVVDKSDDEGREKKTPKI